MNEQKLSGDGYELLITRHQNGGQKSILLQLKSSEPCLLHWGFSNTFNRVWRKPPETCWPRDTKSAAGDAVQTPFSSAENPVPQLRVELGSADADGISFVLFFPEKKRWVKNGNEDFHVSFDEKPDADAAARKIRDLSEAIANAEAKSSWTLMHRFNLCHDMLGAAASDPEAMAVIFVWLRYSAIRQLAWQRNYNTQPRELAHSQDRLTLKLAGIWRGNTASRPWVRLMFTTLGRGGEGQRVRDEILNIMHRHHIKEVHGHFIEEWHQKLHNNTTPDDVVICEAFIAFLESNANQEVFYNVLKNGGVTRERLRSFERPIKSDPNGFGDRNAGIINDFKGFLRILKSMHSGTDFDTMFDAARRHLSSDLKKKLGELAGMRHPNASQMEIARRITGERFMLGQLIHSAKDDATLRDLLFLDLALEAWMRLSAERQDLSRMNRDGLAELLHLTLRNIRTSGDLPEYGICEAHWAALLSHSRDGADWALHAKSVADRIGRAVQERTDGIYSTMQPKAEFLGQAFKAESWSIPLFSEEVVRGGMEFVASLILRRLDPILREAAGLGGWQVVSGGKATGRCRHVASLSAVQGQKFAEQTVLLADSVSGNEDIPDHVTAVLTSSGVDIVSHAAVRARNAGVLFATCFNPEAFDRIKTMNGQTLSVFVNSRGDVEYAESTGAPKSENRSATASHGTSRIRSRNFSAWAVSASEFTRENTGGKSNNLNALRGKLPDWIGLPKSIAMPFGAFEEALKDEMNRGVREKCATLLMQTETDFSRALSEVRAKLMEMKPPSGLQADLQAVWSRAGLPEITWEEAWRAVRKVWASKWNDRAWLSRRARGIPDSELMMAVLIQEVINAEYAFVIHTGNPMDGNRGEIYTEVVLGLGETLVGNYPGRALGAICRKNDLSIQLLSYPGKSVGLYGRGIIFRSDSNGEDLEDFAGAGLYDSFLAEEPERRILNFSNERLLWDGGFRANLIQDIARVGIEVEKACGIAQDIEGAVSGGKFHVVQTRAQVGLPT